MSRPPSAPTRSIFSSSISAFGLALVEALALDVPVVASRIPVFEELAGPGAPGVRFFAPPEDAARLARAVLDILDRPPSGRRERNAPERVRAMFSAERMVADYLTLYERLLARDEGSKDLMQARRSGRDRSRSVDRRNGTYG